MVYGSNDVISMLNCWSRALYTKSMNILFVNNVLMRIDDYTLYLPFAPNISKLFFKTFWTNLVILFIYEHHTVSFFLVKTIYYKYKILNRTTKGLFLFYFFEQLCYFIYLSRSKLYL